MNITALALVIVAALAGVAMGWLWATRRLGADREQMRSDLGHLQGVLDAERAASTERERAGVADEQRLRETFSALSSEALARNSEQLMAMAQAQLATAQTAAGGDLAQRQQAIQAMVEPLKESLTRVQEQLTSSERARAMAESALREHLDGMRQSSEQLRTETSQLVTALRAPQVRGRWGELQLERTVEAAGLTEHVDYVTQPTVTVDGTVQRPDLVVHLVGGKNVVVDSKVAFSAYLEAMEARDEQSRAARLKAHARHLRDHIDALSAKNYWERFTPSPEFVVCFVPADAFLDAALREDPSLLEHAFARNVVVATPSTLIALLRTVAYTWRQEALAANAAEVHQLGRELYQRISTMGGHIDKLGRALNNAVGSYNQTVTSLESRVLVTARKMTDLKAVEPGNLLDAPTQVTETPRSTQAPELTEQRVVAITKQRVVNGQIELLGPADEAIGS